MLRAILVGLAVAGLVFAAGCDRDQGTGGAEEPPEHPGAGPGEVETGTGETTEEAPEGWAAETKKEVVELARKQVERLRKNLDDLGEVAAQKSEEAERNWQEDLKPRLERQLKQAEKELEELRESSGETWQEVKERVKKTLGNLKDAYHAARRELQEDEEEGQQE
jgi:hypothetical protein